jgi:hypothetical protein
MPEDRLIDPAWLIKARKDRKAFAVRVALVFGILSMLAWWALPRLQEQHAVLEKVRLTARRDATPPAAPILVKALAYSAGVFKVFWAGIAIGCAAGILLAFTGKIDALIPTLNLVLLLAGAAGLALGVYVYYAPTLILLDRLN